MFFIIIVDPWEAKPSGLIGPFKTELEGTAAWTELLKLGAHPDCFGKMVSLTDMSLARAQPPYLTADGDEDLPAPHPVETRRY